MCGVAGFVARPGRSVSALRLRHATEVLSHRGPDGRGAIGWTWAGTIAGTDEPIHHGLAHTRLSILDLSPAGHQPMSSADGAVTMSFNGEIYNYIELREELAAAGHSFQSSGDSEVLLHAYLEWGMDCIERLNGMYAFLVVDHRTQEFLAARDPFGIKPLLYEVDEEGTLSVASEIKALGTAGGRRVADPTALLRFLRFGEGPQDGTTIYTGVYQVPPGGQLRCKLNSPVPHISRHLFMPPEPLDPPPTFAQATTRVRQLFLQSVQLHARSDVPVGCALSGGLDSSSILAALRHTLGSSQVLHAFTFTAPGSPVDERAWAETAAGAAGATLHTIAPDAKSMFEDLPFLVASNDMPIPSVSFYAQFKVFQRAREVGVPVLLDGQGADELLGGYDHYLGARMASMLRRGQFTRAARLARAGRARGMGPSGSAGRAFQFLLPGRAERWARRAIGRSLIPEWVDSTWFTDRGAATPSTMKPRGPAVLRGRLLQELRVESIPNLLRAEDHNSMAWSVESRVPFLTVPFANYVLSLPEDYLIGDDAESKRVFRAAMRGLVPDAILDRRDKIGFAPPSVNWLHQDSSQTEPLLRLSLARLPFLDHREIANLWQSSATSKRSADICWRILFLASWADQHQVAFS